MVPGLGFCGFHGSATASWVVGQGIQPRAAMGLDSAVSYCLDGFGWPEPRKEAVQRRRNTKEMDGNRRLLACTES